MGNPRLLGHDSLHSVTATNKQDTHYNLDLAVSNSEMFDFFSEQGRTRVFTEAQRFPGLRSEA
jgi:hypothetical protein